MAIHTSPSTAVLLASSKEANLIGPVKHYDGRSLAARCRTLAQMKGTDVMIELFKAAQKTGHKADYVLFDTWFSNHAQSFSRSKISVWRALP